MGHEGSGDRIGDMPAYLRWAMIFIKQIGFPIVICCWLMWQRFVSDKETIVALQGFKEVMVQVKDTLEQQNRILRHRSKDD